MKGQPLQYTKDGRINGCGVRIVGTTTVDPQNKRVRMIDVSFNVMFPIAGTIKGGMLDTTYSNVAAGNISSMTKVNISNVWMKTQNGVPTRPFGGEPTQAASDKTHLMYFTRWGNILPLFEAVRKGHPIHVGFTVPADALDYIFFGRVEMTEGESAQSANCVRQWLDSIETSPSTRPR